MLLYTDIEIRNVLEKIIGHRNFTETPIGNHELKRHWVYRIDFQNRNSLVFKLYYINNRRNREIAALSLLNGTNVKCGSIVDYGTLNNGEEWMLFSYIEGEIFDKVEGNIAKNHRLKIFEDMGSQLGQIHGRKIFNFWGDWDEYGNSINHVKDYYEYFVSSREYRMSEIMRKELPQKKLLKEAIDIIRENYNIIKSIEESRLCHNDFDGRNILVKKHNQQWELNGIIDFEQSIPGNIEIDIANLYVKYFLENPSYEKAFFKGYNKHYHLNEGFYKRLDFYKLCIGLDICSWAFEQAQDYYKKGIDLIMGINKLG